MSHQQKSQKNIDTDDKVKQTKRRVKKSKQPKVNPEPDNPPRFVEPKPTYYYNPKPVDHNPKKTPHHNPEPLDHNPTAPDYNPKAPKSGSKTTNSNQQPYFETRGYTSQNTYTNDGNGRPKYYSKTYRYRKDPYDSSSNETSSSDNEYTDADTYGDTHNGKYHDYNPYFFNGPFNFPFDYDRFNNQNGWVLPPFPPFPQFPSVPSVPNKFFSNTFPGFWNQPYHSDYYPDQYSDTSGSEHEPAIATYKTPNHNTKNKSKSSEPNIQKDIPTNQTNVEPTNINAESTKSKSKSISKSGSKSNGKKCRSKKKSGSGSKHPIPAEYKKRFKQMVGQGMGFGPTFNNRFDPFFHQRIPSIYQNDPYMYPYDEMHNSRSNGQQHYNNNDHHK